MCQKKKAKCDICDSFTEKEKRKKKEKKKFEKMMKRTSA